MPIAVIVMPDSRIRCARVTNSEPIVLPTVGLPSVRSRIRFTVPGSLEAWRAWLKAASSPSYIAVRPLTEIAFTAAATSREFPTRVMGSWTVTASENETIEIWSVGRSCLMRASAAVFACSIFSPSIDPLESIAREMLRTRPAITGGRGQVHRNVHGCTRIRLQSGAIDGALHRQRGFPLGAVLGLHHLFHVLTRGPGDGDEAFLCIASSFSAIDVHVTVRPGRCEELGPSPLEVASGWSPSILRLECLANRVRTKQGIFSLDQLWNRK